MCVCKSKDEWGRGGHTANFNTIVQCDFIVDKVAGHVLKDMVVEQYCTVQRRFDHIINTITLYWSYSI
jgi:hypothetical protein